ncbi:MAG TPA: site-specific integrase [Steroidobacteraceae bacterium]|nr:site-specific integrase [Steroidobacteraceae bacterium]
MGNQRTSGLTKRGGVWHIDKVFRGTRIRESTETGDVAKAQEQLARRIDQIRTATLYGLRLDHTFRAAATKFLEENQHKRSIGDDAMLLRQLDPFIGDLLLKQVHIGSLQRFIAKRRSDGVKTRSINNALALVRHILNLAASEWRDDQGMTWLEYAPKIKLLPVKDGRQPYPLAREEQAMLFQELPDHLARMALFKVNTGCREQEVCGLKWEYEVNVPELETSVFIVPGEKVKNGQDRLVVLNRIARSVVDSQRGRHSEFVFVYAPKPRKAKVAESANVSELRPLAAMNSTAWKSARIRAADKWEQQTGVTAPEGFRKVRVHDLKHTFGRRLRAAGVSFEDRQDLLGHKSGRITTHYSAAELENLIAAADRVCDEKSHKSPTATGLRRIVS